MRAMTISSLQDYEDSVSMQQASSEVAETVMAAEPRATVLEHVMVYAGCVLFSIGCWAAAWELCRALFR
jgi:uncharacterized membrane protein YiaA